MLSYFAAGALALVATVANAQSVAEPAQVALVEAQFNASGLNSGWSLFSSITSILLLTGFVFPIRSSFIVRRCIALIASMLQQPSK